MDQYSSLPSPQIHITNTTNENVENKYKEIISTLPRENYWNCSSLDYVYQYKGFWHYNPFLEGIMCAQEHFRAQSNDIILASFPKTGTTWLKALTFSIITRNSMTRSLLLVKVPHDCVPFLELDLANDSSTNRNSEIPLVATHLPYTSLPNSILDFGCKIVYIWRDPKDVFVSLWYFIAKQLISKGIEPISLNEAFEMFCQGIVNYGPYWDHVLGYWKAKLEFPDKIMFLKYEEMKKDTCFCVKKLAEFIGYPFTLEEEEKGVVQNIINLCSLENLSNLDVNKNGKHRENTPLAIQNNVYFRNGKVGDWKNELTPEMGARLNKIMEHKLSQSGSGLMSM